VTVVRTAIALGSNLGDRLGFLRFGFDRLCSIGSVIAVSSLYETAPVGGPAQGRYLNATVVIETDLLPLDLLARLQEIEQEANRVRSERWGPRTLDLDIVAWDAEPLSVPALVVPHPGATERRFVLAPLAEVWPEAEVAPGLTAASALPAVKGQDVRRWHGHWVDEMPHLGPAAGWWVGAQVILFVAWGGVLVTTAAVAGSPWRWALGGGLAAAALALGAAAVLTLGGELSPFPQPRSGASLVMRGPYRLVRHPIYGAIVLGFVGISVLFGSAAALTGAVVLAGFFRAKSSVEERANTIGIPGYGEYLAAVRRRFVPFVW
jgi:2-amino-4-hydroxy-6-hydroxymethyldihydropteridine diphosphokinase